MAHFTVFVLACFVGYMVVWNVTPALHTPLMSVTNAISSIIIIGAILQISLGQSGSSWIAGFTVLLTSINIAGGFAVTRRMLRIPASYCGVVGLKPTFGLIPRVPVGSRSS